MYNIQRIEARDITTLYFRGKKNPLFKKGEREGPVGYSLNRNQCLTENEGKKLKDCNSQLMKGDEGKPGLSEKENQEVGK